MHADDPHAAAGTVAGDLPVDPAALREEVRGKYREVAVDPGASFHFHIGRGLARRLGYEAAAVDALPDPAVESFAGVGNPFSLRQLAPGENGPRPPRWPGRRRRSPSPRMPSRRR